MGFVHGTYSKQIKDQIINHGILSIEIPGGLNPDVHEVQAYTSRSFIKVVYLLDTLICAFVVVARADDCCSVIDLKLKTTMRIFFRT